MNYNVRALLAECLTSIESSMSHIDYEIIVVDNDSQDGSADLVKAHFPKVRLIANSSNVGFTKGNNQAFNISRGRYLLMLNPDTRIVRNALPELIDYLDRQSKVGVVGCKMLNSDSTLQPSCYNFPSLKEIFGMYFFGSSYFGGLVRMDYSKEREVDFVRGAFLAVRRTCLKKVGFLDENIFMFGEETDLCYRIKQNGWKVVYYPKTVIIHHRGKSTGQLPDNMYVQRIRSLLYYFGKNYGIYKTVLLRFIIITGVALRMLLTKLPIIKYGRNRDKMLSISTQKLVIRAAIRFW
ncbi:glycosyltransferase family 2 protein [bacterium]|nr:glycosyltransferase family 2 protein [bacterium]